jgi:thiol-disulfide isomerase/thioredoxin
LLKPYVLNFSLQRDPMNSIRHILIVAATVLLTAPLLNAQVSESAINKQLEKLRSLSAEQRLAATTKTAADIRTLPAGTKKVDFAYRLANLVTEGDQGAVALQAVADTLSQALEQSPVPAKGDQPPAPYLELASLVRYKNVTTTLKNPLFVKAGQVLIANDADVEKADFTLKDLHNKKVTLSELRGKIVLVNFWATWCPPCRMEMPDLSWIYDHYKSQGLVILSITSEDVFTVGPFVVRAGYNPPVLIDAGGKVAKQFHVDGIPRSFVFNREGKLVGESIDQCTQRQFLDMLGNTDLHN